MAANPTFVLVPGMWHRPAFFNKLKDHLSKRGFPSVAIDMPSSNFDTNASIFSRDPDIEAIAFVIKSILDRGDDVVVVMHSFGGISGTEAAGRVLEEASFQGEEERGGKGKIIRLVYVTAFLASEDDAVPAIQNIVSEYAPDFFDVQVRPIHCLSLLRDLRLHHIHWLTINPTKQDGGILSCNQRAKDWFYGDELPPTEQEKHFRSLSTNPIAPFFEKVRYAAWKLIPSTYIYSTVDKAVPYAMMKHMVERAREDVSAEGWDSGLVFGDELGEFHVDAAHSAIFLAPERVVQLGGILVQVAEGLESS